MFIFGGIERNKEREREGEKENNTI